MHLSLSVQFKLTRVGKIQRTKTKRKKMFHSVILNDIKRLLNQSVYFFLLIVSEALILPSDSGGFFFSIT